MPASPGSPKSQHQHQHHQHLQYVPPVEVMDSAAFDYRALATSDNEALEMGDQALPLSPHHHHHAHRYHHRTSSRGSATTPRPEESETSISPLPGRRATISNISEGVSRMLLPWDGPAAGSDISPEEEETEIRARFVRSRRRSCEPTMLTGRCGLAAEPGVHHPPFDPSRRRSSEPTLSMVDLARLRISVDSFLATAASCEATPTSSPLPRSTEDLRPLGRPSERSPRTNGRHAMHPDELMSRLNGALAPLSSPLVDIPPSMASSLPENEAISQQEHHGQGHGQAERQDLLQRPLPRDTGDSDSGISSSFKSSSRNTLKSFASQDLSPEPSLSGYGSDTSSTTVSSLQSCSSASSSRSARMHWVKAKQMVRMYCAFQRQNYPWVQLAGHEDGFRKGESPEWILKAGTEEERVSGVG